MDVNEACESKTFRLEKCLMEPYGYKETMTMVVKSKFNSVVQTWTWKELFLWFTLMKTTLDS